MKKSILIMGLVALMSVSAHAAPKSFSSAKKILGTKIYKDTDDTFYCGCDMYYADKKGKPWLTPSHNECGFEPRKQEKRAARIEWEHVVPAWYFGHQRQCWQEGGRSNCRHDDYFETMEADLHNLVPAIGEVNGDRSNYSLTMVSSNISPQYGQCDMKVDFKSKKAQPTASVRGDIARVYFYMATQYGLKLSKQDIQVYTAWHNFDPVDSDEKRIHNLKAKYQGHSNPYVTGELSPSDFKNKSMTETMESVDFSSMEKEITENLKGSDEMIKKMKSAGESAFNSFSKKYLN